MKYTFKFRSGGPQIDLDVPVINKGDILQLTITENSSVPGVAPVKRKAGFEVEKVVHIFGENKDEYLGTELQVNRCYD